MGKATRQAPCRCLKIDTDRLLESAYNVDRAAGVYREPIAMARAPNVIRTGSLQVPKDRHGNLSMKGV